MGSVLTPPCSRTRQLFTLRARHLNGEAVQVLELSGETDIATLALLRQELAHLASTNPREAVVDVTRLEFCDVAAAQLILVAGRRIPFTLRGATGPVRRVFDLLDTLQKQRLPHYLAPATPVQTARALGRPWTAQAAVLEHSAGVGTHRVAARKSA